MTVHLPVGAVASAASIGPDAPLRAQPASLTETLPDIRAGARHPAVRTPTKLAQAQSAAATRRTASPSPPVSPTAASIPEAAGAALPVSPTADTRRVFRNALPPHRPPNDGNRTVSDDERRALRIIDADKDGCTEHVMTAKGFSLEFLAGLVRAELADVTIERVYSGKRQDAVCRLRITDAGKRAIGRRTPLARRSTRRKARRSAGGHASAANVASNDGG